MIRANETLSSLDQVTTAMVLLGMGLIILATNWIVIWTGQRVGSSVYTKGINLMEERWSRFLVWNRVN